MNHSQHGTTASAWPPNTADAMDTQQLQANPSWGTMLNDPSITDMIQAPHSEPWNALGQQRPSRPSTQNSFALMSYSHLQSEDGTVPESAPEDARYQYEDTFLFTGTSQETAGAAHMQQLLNSFQISNPGPHMPSMQDDAMEVASTFSTTTAATGYRGPFKCLQCNKTCKSQSSLKKHALSHSRPHRCNYPNCSKAMDGFGTPNDLQRHKFSVHKEANFGYKCTLGDCAGASQPKVWIRKDNFRTHMSKVHGRDISPDAADAEYWVKLEPRVGTTAPSSEVTPSEDLPDIQLPGTDSHVAESTLMDVDQPQYQTPQATSAIVSDASYDFSIDGHSHATPRHLSFQGYTRPTGICFGPESVASLQGHQLPGFGSPSFATPSIQMTNGGIFVSSRASNTSYPIAVQEGPPSQDVSAGDETRVVYSPKASSIFSSSAPRENLTAASSQKVDALSHDALVNEGWTTSQLVDHLGTFPLELLEQALYAKKQIAQNANDPEESVGCKSRYECSQCDKVCNRACELKKHMKRHDRPYGCTVKACGKSFGSKNDWKRHESGQHEPVDAWACDEDGCVAICEDRLTFLQHLMGAHEMVHGEDLQSRAQSCRIGRQCDAKFWCGFCMRVIEIDDLMVQEDSSNGTHWSRRFDHIDGHLFGKGSLQKMDKSEWRFLEDQMKEDTRRRVDQMSATASVRSTTTSNETPNKRKGSEHADCRPRKRADVPWVASSR